MLKLWILLICVSIASLTHAQNGSQAEVLVNEAKEIRLRGQLDSAIIYLRKALTLYESSQLNEEIVATNVLLGDMHRRKAELPIALGYYQKALKLHKNKSDETAAKIYNQIGIIYDLTEDNTKAIKFYEESLQIKKQVYGSNHKDIANAYNNIGDCLVDLKQFDAARDNHLMSLAIRKKLKDQIGLSVSYINVGNTYSSEGQYQKALEYHTKGLEILNSSEKAPATLTTQFIRQIAAQHYQLGNYNEALVNSQKAMQVLMPELSLTNLYANPNLANLRYKKHIFRTLFIKGKILYGQYQQDINNVESLEQAYQTFVLTAELLDSIRNDFKTKDSKLLLLQKARAVYEAAIETALKLREIKDDAAYLNAAFYFAEKSKSTLLYASMKDEFAKSFAGIPKEVLHKEHILKEKIGKVEKLAIKFRKKAQTKAVDSLETIIFDLKQEYYGFIDQLEKQYPAYYNLKYKLNTTSITEVQNQLVGNNEVLAEYFVGEENIYIFVIQPEKAEVHYFLKPYDFEANVLSFLQSIRDLNFIQNQPQRAFQQYASNAWYFYEALIAPLYNETDSINRLIVVPDGMLGYISFDALISDPTDIPIPEYRTLPYLVYDMDISYGYSCTLLLENRQKQQNRRVHYTTPCAAFAPSIKHTLGYKPSSPRAEAQILPALPASENELKAISELLSGEFFYGKDATETQFRNWASQSQILHLAMHTLINDEAPLQSHLVFTNTPADNHDGYLYAFELYNMQLSAQLAVLSACETGSGRLQQGEGIMSLSRAFMYAGCESIVMSLWRADDIATANIITKFYEELTQGQPKDKALSNAKRTYLEGHDPDYSHPYYWSGFVHIGNPNPLSFSIPTSRSWILWGIPILFILSALGLSWIKRR